MTAPSQRGGRTASVNPLAVVAKHANAAARSLASRDAAIAQARADGYSLRKIAKVARVSHTEVANIIRRSSGD